MYILDELWFGNLSPCDKFYRSDSEYARLFHRFNEQYDFLHKTLTGELLERFEISQNARDNMSAISEQEYFIEGFRMGARLMVDVLGSQQGIFCNED